MNKKEAYAQLVQAVQEDYRQRTHEDDEKKGRPYVAACAYEGKQINLWSYWQGSLDAKILILGQDWGNYNPDNRELDCIMQENFRKMDAGEDARYFDNVPDKIISVTDGNLIELVKSLDASYDIRNRKYKDLFFSNLCLGYRNEGYSGGFRRKWLTEDVKYLVGYDENGEHIHGLLEIIKPEIVICLGKEVYGVVAKALGKGVSSAELKRYYQKLDEGRNFVKPEGRGWSFRVYGMAHPGKMGLANRKANSMHKNDNIASFELQCSDWQKIKCLAVSYSKV